MVNHSYQWVLICSNGKPLTNWSLVEPFLLSEKQICNSLAGCIFSHFHKLFWSGQTWKVTHKLGVWFLSVILICSITEATHSLDAHSAILICGSDFLKHWGKTHNLSVTVEYSCQWLFICSNTREQLTYWMCVQSFSSVFLSAQTLENSSLPKCMFKCSHQQFWSASRQKMQLTS